MLGTVPLLLRLEGDADLADANGTLSPSSSCAAAETSCSSTAVGSVPTTIRKRIEPAVIDTSVTHSSVKLPGMDASPYPKQNRCEVEMKRA
jgi:hypothetical protein